MLISRIDHISVAVKDYPKALQLFEAIFGAAKGVGAEEQETGYLWQIFSMGDLSRLELLTPTREKSFLDGFLKKKEGGFHHITLETPNIKEMKKELEKQNIPYFGYNEKPGGEWKELFIHPRDAFGILIQIAEFDPDHYLAPSEKLSQGKRWEIKKNCPPDKIKLSFAHPGGGKVDLEFNSQEVEQLAQDLKKALHEKE